MSPKYHTNYIPAFLDVRRTNPCFAFHRYSIVYMLTVLLDSPSTLTAVAPPAITSGYYRYVIIVTYCQILDKLDQLQMYFSRNCYIMRDKNAVLNERQDC